MKTQKNLKSNPFQFLTPFVVLLGVYFLFKSGYSFGQWLYQTIN